MLLNLLVAVLTASISASAAREAPSMQFTAVNPSGVACRTVARVSMPVPAGTVFAMPGATVATTRQRDVCAQARVITRHPDGSVRVMMLSVPVQLGAGEQAVFECGPVAATEAPASMLEGEDPARIATETYSVVVSGGSVQLLSDDGVVLATVKPFGPELDGEKPTAAVLDAGPNYVWLRCNAEGAQWSTEVDVEVDRFGQITLTNRLQAHEAGNHWTPDFGFEVTARGAELADGSLARPTVQFMGLDHHGRFADTPELVAAMRLADGTGIALGNPLALRQDRGALELTHADGVARVTSNRNQPVENLKQDGLMIQEGQWRVSRLTIAPVSPQELAQCIDAPVQAHAHWRQHDAVYHTGPPIDAQSPLIRRTVDKYIQAMQEMSISGDDWGNMTSWAPQNDGRQINSMVRFNHCRHVWEDYFRSGDPRLLEIARDWSENYRNLSVYWGPNKDYYGGSRRGRALRNEPGSPHGPGTYMVRYNNALGWITKGFAAFWLAYEHTGDPRFCHAAQQQARWSADKMTCLKNEMRSIGGVADFAKLYEYTGEAFYLQQAQRLWEEFKQGQLDNLLFTQHGKPAVGDDLYIQSDEFGYKHQFVKPYIVQYATNALPYLLEHCPGDERLRNTIIALNDWMAMHRQPGGGWGYPHYLTAGMGWNNEYSHGIALACEIEPKAVYLDAIRENLAPVMQLLELYRELAAGINPWESAAGINAAHRQERYKLAADRPVMRDYEDGQVRFGQSPDNCVYAGVLIRDYLRHRPEESLLDETPILGKIKGLRTTLDPTVTAPARVPLVTGASGASPRAEIALMVDFRGTEQMPGSLRVTGLPQGITAEPETLEWTVTRGRHRSPKIRLTAVPEAAGEAVLQWRVGHWQGRQTVTLAKAAAVDPGGKVGYIGGEHDALGPALLALGIQLPTVLDLSEDTLKPLAGIIVGGEAHSVNHAGLADTPDRLIAFARSGGRVAILQLQDQDYRPEYLPLPLALSDDESTLAEILQPQHAIFSRPNKVGSLSGAVLYDTVSQAAEGWQVLATDTAGAPAILQARVGKGSLLVIQASIDRYVAGTLDPPGELSADACANLLVNVVAYLASRP